MFGFRRRKRQPVPQTHFPRILTVAIRNGRGYYHTLRADEPEDIAWALLSQSEVAALYVKPGDEFEVEIGITPFSSKEVAESAWLALVDLSSNVELVKTERDIDEHQRTFIGRYTFRKNSEQR